MQLYTRSTVSILIYMDCDTRRNNRMISLSVYTEIGSNRVRQLLAPPFFRLARKVGFVAIAQYKSFLISRWGAVAGL